MTTYQRIYVSTADANYTPSGQATYAAARNNTQATNTTGISANIGQNFTTLYVCNQYFPIFDTTTVPSDKTAAILSLLTTTLPPATASADALEVRAVSSTANKIAGGSLDGLTPYFGTLTLPVVLGRFNVPLDITDMARTATCQMVAHSRNERLNVAPTAEERATFHTGDRAGTVDDPYLQIITGSLWEFVGVSAAATVTGTPLTLTEPAGVADGDLLIACIAVRTTSTTSITNTGWTLVNEQKTNNILTTSSAVASGAMFYQVRSGTPDLTFTLPASGTSVCYGQMVAYRGNAATTPRDVSTAATTPISTTAVSVTGLTTTQADDLIVAMCAGGQEAAWSAFNATDPAGASGFASITGAPEIFWQERADSSTTTGTDTSLAIFDAVKVTAGATGNLTATASVSAGHVVIAGAFKIAAAPAGDGVGDADGTSTASATGAATASANASTAGGTSTASATGTGIKSADASTAAGVGAATATGSSITILEGVGDADGVGAASGAGNALVPAAGDADGTSTASATGQATGAGIGDADGTSTASATGVTIGAGAGDADGVGAATAQGSTGGVTSEAAGTATGTGATTATGTGIKAANASAAAGTGSATATGASTVAGAGSAPATGTANATGRLTGAGIGAAAGIGTAAATATVMAASAGTAAGLGAAISLSDPGTTTGTSLGVGTANAVGVRITASVGTAAGIGAAVGTGAVIAAGAGAAGGTGTAAAVGAEGGAIIAEGVGTAAGVGQADGRALEEQQPIAGGGGGGLRFRPRPAVIEGVGYGVLPELVGLAFGEVGYRPKLIAGRAKGALAIAGHCSCDVGVKGAAYSIARLPMVASANAAAGSSGRAEINLSICKGAAMGDHDPDEHLIIAFMLAA